MISLPITTIKIIKRICWWFSDSKFGCTSTTDVARFGRPMKASSLENTHTQNYRFGWTQRESEGDSEECKDINRPCEKYFTWTFIYEKLCSRWVPHFLTIDQKQPRVDDSGRGLELFHSCIIINKDIYPTMKLSGAKLVGVGSQSWGGAKRRFGSMFSIKKQMTKSDNLKYSLILYPLHWTRPVFPFPSKGHQDNTWLTHSSKILAKSIRCPN